MPSTRAAAAAVAAATERGGRGHGSSTFGGTGELWPLVVWGEEGGGIFNTKMAFMSARGAFLLGATAPSSIARPAAIYFANHDFTHHRILMLSATSPTCLLLAAYLPFENLGAAQGFMGFRALNGQNPDN